MTLETIVPNIAVVATPVEFVFALLIVSEYGGVAETPLDWNAAEKLTDAPWSGEPRSFTVA